MIYVTVERRVARRVEVVWEVLTDVSGLASWVEGIARAERVSAVARGVGLEVALASARSGAAITSRVTAWRDAELLVVETRLPDLLVLDRVVLSGEDGGTTIAVRGELFYENALAEFLARPEGALGGSRDDPAIEAKYVRSLDALVKRIEATTRMPYR